MILDMDITTRVVATAIATTLFATSSAMATTLYTETNSASGNQVQIYETQQDGNPMLTAEVGTGGSGSGAELGSQGSLALSVDHRFLFAVNAGSNDVSSFEISLGGLKLVSRVPSGGTTPISVTTHGDLLYVVNAGDPGNIAGFRIDHNGALSAIAGSSQPLSSSASGPSQIGFDRDGDALVVTERNTNKVVVYHVTQGLAGNPEVHASHGENPFGFAFDRRDDLLIAEAFGATVNGSALSSYDFDDGELSLLSGSIPSEQSAACWVVTARHGRFAYVTNTASGTVTGYKVARDGELTRLTANGITGVTGGDPTDAATDTGRDTLYVLTKLIGQIVSFHVNANGSLTLLGTTAGVAATAAGLVTR
jgi:6-phosphogluconolactonase (cycloisomerase 2 family)